MVVGMVPAHVHWLEFGETYERPWLPDAIGEAVLPEL